MNWLSKLPVAPRTRSCSSPSERPDQRCSRPRPRRRYVAGAKCSTPAWTGRSHRPGHRRVGRPADTERRTQQAHAPRMGRVRTHAEIAPEMFRAVEPPATPSHRAAVGWARWLVACPIDGASWPAWRRMTSWPVRAESRLLSSRWSPRRGWEGDRRTLGDDASVPARRRLLGHRVVHLRPPARTGDCLGEMVCVAAERDHLPTSGFIANEASRFSASLVG